MTDLSSLAERVERLDGPDRQVDADIHLEVYTSITLPDAPAYTASLDTAMQLVPEGWLIQKLFDSGVACRDSLSDPDPIGYEIYKGCTVVLANIAHSVKAFAKTRECAAVSAALKARARVREGK